jgi:hypothetical protein
MRMPGPTCARRSRRPGSGSTRASDAAPTSCTTASSTRIWRRRSPGSVRPR